MASTMLLSECVTISVSSTSSWAKASCVSKRWERGIRIWSSCVWLEGSSGFEQTVKRLSCGPIVVELALPFLAHKPDANRHLHRRSLYRLGLNTLPLVSARGTRGCFLSWLGVCDSWLMLMCKRCSRNALWMSVP